MGTKTTQKNKFSDWEKTKLNNYINIKHGFAFKSQFFVAKGEYVLLTPGNFYEEGGYKYRGENQKYYNGEIPPDYLLKKGDLLVAMTEQAPGLLGSPITILVGNKFLHNQRLGLIERKKPIDLSFLFHFFNLKKTRKDIFDSASGTKVRHTSPEKIGKLKLLLPPLPEQKRIVAVLETWDRAIETMTKKIEIKKQIKKGLMQELLAGKTRLKGFSGKWEKTKIKNICTIKKGEQLNKENMVEDGQYIALNGGIELSGYTNFWNTAENTITISEGGNSCGYVNFNREKFWCGGHCYTAIPLVGINNNFLYQILKFKQSKIMALRVGSGLPNIQKKSLDDFKIEIPKLEEEQQQIATILEIADNEVIALEKKLILLKDQKKYLLNNLITGEIRTPENLTFYS